MHFVCYADFWLFKFLIKDFTCLLSDFILQLFCNRLWIFNTVLVVYYNHIAQDFKDYIITAASANQSIFSTSNLPYGNLGDQIEFISF